MSDEEGSMSEDFSASEEEWKPTKDVYGSARGRGGDTSDDDDSDFEEATPKPSTSRLSAAGKTEKKSLQSNARKATKQLVKKRKSAGQSLRDRLYSKYRPPPKTLTTPTLSPNKSPSSSSSRKQTKNLNPPNESDSNPNGHDHVHHNDNDDGSNSDGSILNYLVNPDELDLQSSFFDKKAAASAAATAAYNSDKPLTPVFDCYAGMKNLSNSSESESELETEMELNAKIHDNDKTNTNNFDFQNLLNNLNDYEQAKESLAKTSAEIALKAKCKTTTATTATTDSNVDVYSLLALGEKTNRLQNDGEVEDDEDEDDDDEDYNNNDNDGVGDGGDLPTSSKLNQSKSTRVKRLSKSRPVSSAVNVDSDDSDWEEVAAKEIVAGNTNHNGNLEIHIEMPDGRKRKKNTKEELELAFKRKLNRELKEQQLLLHKTSLLCRFARFYFYNRLLNDTILMQAALKLLPSQNAYPPEKGTEFKYFEALINWYKSTMKLSISDKFYPEKTITSRAGVRYELLRQIACKEVTCRQDFILIFIVLVRGMGIQCRLVANLQPLPLKPDQSDLIPIKLNSKGNDNDTAGNKLSKKLETTSKKKTKVGKSKNINNNNSQQANATTIQTADENNTTIKETNDISSNNRKAAKSKSQIEEKKHIEHSKTHIKQSSRNQLLKDNDVVENQTNLCSKNAKPSTTRKRSSDRRKENSNEKTIATKTDMGNKANAKPQLERLKRQPKINTNNSDPISNKKAKILIKVASVMPKQNMKNSNKPSEIEQSTTKTSIPKATTAKSLSITTRSTRSRPLSNRTTNAKQSLEDKSHVNNNNIDPELLLNPKSTREILKQRKTAKQTEVEVQVGNGISLPQIDGADDVEMEENVKYMTRKRPHLDRLKSKQFEDTADIEDDDCSSEEFEPNVGKKAKSAPRIRKSTKSSTAVKDQGLITTDEDDELNESKQYNENKNNIWIEVWCDVEEQWMCVDVFKNKIHCIESIRKSASKNLAYVYAFQNDLSLKDVTARYCPNWSYTVRKCRADNDWLITAISLYQGRRTLRDINEDQELRSIHEAKPMPTTISDYKNHPLYALRRHLLKFQAIYPPNCTVLGYVRGEPVYSRDCVHTLHSREIWLKQARVVKLGEKPYKVVKARPKWDRFTRSIIKDLPLEIFGYWQTEDYIPPTAENGIVPRNAYGNVELFKPSMLPKKTVQLRLPGLNRICSKLGVDCAKAVIGFDFHQGACHPTYDGFVVCEEFAETVIDAWHEEQANMERKEREKYEARVYGNWRKLIRGLLIRERVKLKYNL